MEDDELRLSILKRTVLDCRNEEMDAAIRDTKLDINALLRFSDAAKRSADALSAEAFVRLATEEALPVIDVRSPAEFAQGHIQCPHCLNMPLFSNGERHKVGLQYNRRGKGPAMLMGMRMVAPKLEALVGTARAFHADVSCKKKAYVDISAPCLFSLPEHQRPLIGVHCWRGGMRSSSVAWWLKQAGFQPILLKGGYKGYRDWVLNIYLNSTRGVAVGTPRICIVGGRTGSGKTRILHAMQQMGAQVLDLEGLARHRGSAFGWIAQDSQPTSEQFMNDCANAWQKFDAGQWIFIEDEGQAIGKCSTPPVLYDLMRSAPLVINVVVPMEARLKLLVEDYSGVDALRKSPDWQDRVVKSINRMVKRLGGDRTKRAVEAVISGDMRLVAETLITYYDKLYDRHIANEGGNGSGKGERSGAIVLVEAPVDATELDASAVGKLVIARAKASSV